MKGLFVICLLFAIALTAVNAASSDPNAKNPDLKGIWTTRGYLSSKNVYSADGFLGKLGLNGFGEVVITYFPKTNELGVSMTHSYSSVGTLDGAALHIAGATYTWNTGASPFWTYRTMTELDTATKQTDFINAIKDGSAWFQISSSLYPDGVARANLDNTNYFGTSEISFSAVLAPKEATVPAKTSGSASIVFSSASNEIGLSAKVNLGDKSDAVRGYDFVSTIDGSLLYFYNFQSGDKATSLNQIAITNSINYALLNGGNVEVVVRSNSFPEGVLSGILTPSS